MLTFPTLSVTPSMSNYNQTIAHDPTLRNETDGGYVVTRAKFTRLVNKWHVLYKYITNADKSTLETFENDVKVGTDAFYWTEPVSGDVKTVRFLNRIEFPKASLYWNAEFDIEEV